MKRLFLLLLIAILHIGVSDAQTIRDYVRRGNRLMRDTVGGKDNSERAIVQYKKALEIDSTYAIGRYNLACALLRHGMTQDAMKEYTAAARYEQDKQRQSDIYHNIGVLMQSAKQYDKAVECYKNSLRRDPSNNETRYNYVLALWQLRNQQDQQDQDNKDDQQEQDKQQQQDKPKEQDKEQQQKEDKEQPQQQEQQEQQEQQDKMSKENAERLLQAAMRNEKNTQEKMQRLQQPTSNRRLQKQW